MARNFSDWIKGYLDFCRSSEAPRQFHFWTGVSTIAGALRGKVWRQENQFRWTPNFYIVLVGPAGVVQKSTSIGIGMSLLEEVDDPGIRFGPPSATWQALVKVMGEAAQAVEYTLPDGTKETFTISCVTLPVSELGTFMKIAQEGLPEVLIEMWDGQVKKRTWTHSTATTGNYDVQNPWLNMIGGTTPTWLKNHMPESQIGGGLMSRIIFVYGETKQRFVAYPSQEWKGADYYVYKRRLVEDLTEIAKMTGHFELTPDAIEWGEGWYRNLHMQRPLHLADERFDAYLARKQAFLHKLAMIRAAATTGTLILTRETLQWADQALLMAEADMIKAFRSIGLTDQYRHVESILAVVRARKHVRLGDVFAAVRTSMTREDFLKAVAAAETAGDLRIEETRTPQGEKIAYLRPPTKPDEPPDD